MKMSKIETALRVGLDFRDAFNRRDVAAMLLLLSEDCALSAADGASHTGKAAIAAFWQNFFRASPAAHIKLEEAFGMGFRCVLRWQRDDADGRSRARGADIFQLRNGLICEQTTYLKSMNSE